MLRAARFEFVQRERKELAQDLRYSYNEAQRAELYAAWGVSVGSKERKLQMVNRLWHRDTLKQPNGMDRSAEMVVQLSGADAAAQFMQLVFGGGELACTWQSGPGRVSAGPRGGGEGSGPGVCLEKSR